MEKIEPFSFNIGPLFLNTRIPNETYLTPTGYAIKGEDCSGSREIALQVEKKGEEVDNYLIMIKKKAPIFSSGLIITSVSLPRGKSREETARLGLIRDGVFENLITVPLVNEFGSCKLVVEGGGMVKADRGGVGGVDIYGNYTRFSGDEFVLFGDQYLRIDTTAGFVFADLFKSHLQITNPPVINHLMRKLNLKGKFFSEEEFIKWWLENREMYPWLEETMQSVTRQRSFILETVFPKIEGGYLLREIEDWLFNSPQTTSEVSSMFDSLGFSATTEEVTIN